MIHKQTFEFVDLFAGIGGFRLGLEANGGKHVFASEWDAKAAATYAAWFGDNDISTEDFRTLDYEKIPDHDFLTAGFPCQPFSIAGVSKKNSLNRSHGFDDLHQGNLFEFLAKFISVKRPPVFLLENVKNLLSHDGGNTWKTIQEILHGLDYVFDHQVLHAYSVVPQSRPRVYIVGFDKRVFGENALEKFSFPKFSAEKKKLESILDLKPSKKYMLTDNLWDYLQAYKLKHAAKGNGFGFKLFSGSETSGTLSARYYKDGAEILVKQRGWKNPRKLSPKEALLLMGFSSRFARMRGLGDEFPQIASDMQTYKQAGNAVVPEMVELISAQILTAVELLGGFPRRKNGI
jgi:DNA (cytosine-5)-methyltransferase 1